MTNYLKDLFFKLGIYKYAKKYFKKPYQYIYGIPFRFSSKETLKKFIQVMNKNNYQFWLEFGTLLGAVREGKMISHDLDIDVAMHIKDRDSNMRLVLEKEGFKLYKQAKTLEGLILEETYKYKTARVDIFYTYEKDNKYIIYDYMTTDDLSPNECIKRYGGLIVYQNIMSKFDLKKSKFYNQDVYIPDNYTKHLEELYGDDYMVPNKNWSIDERKVRYKTKYIAKI